MKKENIIFGLIGVAISAYIFWETSKFPLDNIMNIGPSFFPRFLAVGLFIFSMILIFLNLFRVEEKVEVKFSIKDPGVHRAAISLIITVLYGLIMGFLGFIITTILYLCSLMYLMKLRKWIRMLIISTGVSLIIYTIFKTLLNISLPIGFWG